MLFRAVVREKIFAALLGRRRFGGLRPLHRRRAGAGTIHRQRLGTDIRLGSLAAAKQAPACLLLRLAAMQ